MKHIHGVEIRLLDHNGIPIAEGAPHKRTESSLLRFNGQVGSRNICLRPGKKFRVEVSIHNKFKFYAAGGVKIVIVANGIYAGDPERRVHQRHGMWWIDAKDDMNGPALSGEGMRYVIEGFTVWNKRRASREEYTSFLAPDVGGKCLAIIPRRIWECVIDRRSRQSQDRDDQLGDSRALLRQCWVHRSVR